MGSYQRHREGPPSLRWCYCLSVPSTLLSPRSAGLGLTQHPELIVRGRQHKPKGGGRVLHSKSYEAHQGCREKIHRRLPGEGDAWAKSPESNKCLLNRQVGVGEGSDPPTPPTPAKNKQKTAEPSQGSMRQ